MAAFPLGHPQWWRCGSATPSPGRNLDSDILTRSFQGEALIPDRFRGNFSRSPQALSRSTFAIVQMHYSTFIQIALFNCLTTGAMGITV
ncbi:MAG: hypothetical protein ACO3EZ_19845 [Prochlorotrichaceae cyanobacterium]